MDMYSQKDPSLPQKVVILSAELLLIAVSAWVLFGDLLEGIRAFGPDPAVIRNFTLFIFNLVVFGRFLLTLFYFLERKIPWEEAFSVPVAFALYLLGFPLLARSATTLVGMLELAGIMLFMLGSFLNTFSEYQRKRFKSDPANQGKLYTGGLFACSMHPNYFGDLIWVSGYACVTHNPFSALIPAFLFCFFYFYNAPKLDAHLRERYGKSFVDYERHTKRFIPFVL